VENRVPTGIQGLDNILQGGIPRGFFVAATGEPGTGKTVFCINFIGNGLKIGDSGIYVTTEESRESIIKQAEMFGYDFRRAIREGSLIMIDALMEERGDPWSLRELDIEELINRVIEAKKTLGSGHARLVIDSMSAFWLDKPAMARKYSYMVKRILSKWNMTVILTSQYAVTTSLGFGFGIEHVADGIIRFKKTTFSGYLRRFLVVEKMRQTDHDKRVFEIDIVDGKGLVILKPVSITRGELGLPLSVLYRMLESEIRKETELTEHEDTED